MKLIIGLGNSGEKYIKTRHNLGFIVIEELAEKIKVDNWKEEKQFKADIAQGISNNEKIILAKPQTFMNNSGNSVKSIADYYKINSENILVIHDDIDLELGEIRIQKNRGSAGHNGVQSIINYLKTKDFIRIRIGIKPIEKEILEAEKFVLEKFSRYEEEIVSQTIKKAADTIVAAI